LEAVQAFTAAASYSLDGFTDQSVLGGLTVPISMAFMPDGRMLVLEKDGTIFIADPNSGAQSVYMQLNNVNFGQERGLLDIALAPDFDPQVPGADYFYLYYTPLSPTHARIARFTHQENSGGLTSRGDLASEFQVWQDTDGYVTCCHYGGGLDFGPDGKLWLTTADKFTAPAIGEGGPDFNYPQDLTKTGGKVIRVNPDGTVPNGTDGWPANPFINPIDDDPFVPGNQNYNDYIWDYGLRNPFRAEWDIPSGRFFIAEVGGNQHSLSHEDIHIATLGQPGTNHGWPYYEGTPENSTGVDPNGPFAPPHGFGASVTDTRAPLYSRPHDGAGTSITGGDVYRGDQFPAEWQGAYFYGDYTNDFIRFLTFDASGNVSGDFPFKPSPQIPGKTDQVVSITVGADGALYYALLGGQVRRVVHASRNQAPQIVQAVANTPTGDPPLLTTFTATVSDAESNPLTYQWFYGDGTFSSLQSVPGNGQISTPHTYNVNGTYQAFLKVSDGTTTTFSNFITIQVGAPNLAPVVNQINASPTQGDPPLQITFTANVTDPNGDPLTYQWFYGDGSSSGSLPVPANGQINRSHTYAADGVFDALLIVSDGLLETNMFAPTVAVGNVTVPPVTSGLVLLLESGIKVPLQAGSTVVGWLDGSGRGNNLTAFGDPQLVAAATPGGQPAIVFDGVGDKLERLAADTINQFPAGNQDRTVFSVVKYLDSQDFYAGVAFGEGAPNEAFGLVTRSNDGRLAVQGWGTKNDFVSTSVGQGAGWLTQSVVLSSGTMSHYKDGTRIALKSHTYATDMSGANSKIVIGQEIAGYGTTKMEVGAVLVYDRALSESERLQIESYLHSKYFVGAPTPVAGNDAALVALGGNAVIEVLRNDTAPGSLLDPTSVTIVGLPTHGVASVDPLTGLVTYEHFGTGGSVDSFTYKIRDVYGNQSNVATVTVSVGAGAILTGGLVLQLESDAQVATTGNIVTGWIDSSGTGNDLQTVVGDPTLINAATPSGKPAIEFDGDDSLARQGAIDALNQMPGGTSDRTMFLVAKYDAAATTAGVAFGDAVPNEAFGLTVDGGSGGLTVEGFGNGNNFVTTAVGNGAGWLVQSVVLSANAISQYRDGKLIITAAHAFNTDVTSATSHLVLAGGIGSGFADMDIAAVLVYDRALSEAERHQVQAALQTKYLNAPTPNTPPTITSPAAVNVAENNSAVVTLTATDPDPDMVTFSIVGGVDQALFQISGNQGQSLAFIAAPDFETPQDAGSNNVYDIIIAAFDGTATTTLAMAVTVTDVNEGLPAAVLNLDASVGVTFDGTGAVSLWQDQSTRGNDVSAIGSERPIVGAVFTPAGQNAIRFDGNDDRLLRTLGSGFNGLPTGNAARTMVLVAQVHDAAAWGGVAYGAGKSNQTFGLVVGGNGSSKGKYTLQGYGGSNDLRSTTDAFNPPGTTAGWAILTGVHIDDGSDPAPNAFLYANGVQIAAWDHQYNTVLSNGSNVGGSSFSRLVLGEEIKEAGHVRMDIAAVQIYDHALSVTERQAVEAALQAKFLTPGNTPPVFTSPAAVSVVENTTAVTTLTASDPNPDTITFSIAGGVDAAFFQVTGVRGESLSFKVPPNFGNPQDAGGNNVYDLIVAAFDGNATTTLAMTVTVTAQGVPNTPPTITSPAAVSVSENSTPVVTLTATDPNPTDVVTFSIVGGADQALFQVAGSQGQNLSFIAPPDFENPQDAGGDNVYNIIIAAIDGTATTTLAMAITVTDVLEGGTPELVLNLDAAVGVTSDVNGAVSLWQDQTAYGNSLLASGSRRPTVGAVVTPSGQNAIRFDGTDDRLIRTLGDGFSGLPTGNASRTMIMVAQFHNANAWAGVAYGAGKPNQAFGPVIGHSGGNAGRFALQGWGGGNDLRSRTNGFNPPGTTAGWVILTGVQIDDGSNPADNAFLFANGVQIASWDHQYNTVLNDSGTVGGNSFSRFVLGQEIGEAGHVRFDIAAVQVYEQALTAIQRQAAEAALRTKFLTPLAPAARSVVSAPASAKSLATPLIDALALELLSRSAGETKALASPRLVAYPSDLSAELPSGVDSRPTTAVDNLHDLVDAALVGLELDLLTGKI
jgi:hypothetical protein